MAYYADECSPKDEPESEKVVQAIEQALKN